MAFDTLKTTKQTSRDKRINQRGVLPSAIKLRNLEIFELGDQGISIKDEYGNPLFTITRTGSTLQIQIGDNVAHIDAVAGDFVAAQAGGFTYKSNTANRLFEGYGHLFRLADNVGTHAVRMQDSNSYEFAYFPSDGGLVLVPQGVPSSPQEGQVYYDSAANKLKLYTGAGWETITSA